MHSSVYLSSVSGARWLRVRSVLLQAAASLEHVIAPRTLGFPLTDSKKRTFNCCAGGVPAPLQQLCAASDALPDPVALLVFEPITRRQQRLTARTARHLCMDIKLEALFANGIVPPPAAPVGAGPGQPPQPGAVLHALQAAYSRSEALQLAAAHTNAALHSLLGCSGGGGGGGYEALLDQLLAGEAQMRAVLHECCLCMLEGVAVSGERAQRLPGPHPAVVRIRCTDPH
jgi:hypothetical protein